MIGFLRTREDTETDTQREDDVKTAGSVMEAKDCWQHQKQRERHEIVLPGASWWNAALLTLPE